MNLINTGDKNSLIYLYIGPRLYQQKAAIAGHCSVIADLQISKSPIGLTKKSGKAL